MRIDGIEPGCVYGPLVVLAVCPSAGTYLVECACCGNRYDAPLWYLQAAREDRLKLMKFSLTCCKGDHQMFANTTLVTEAVENMNPAQQVAYFFDSKHGQQRRAQFRFDRWCRGAVDGTTSDPLVDGYGDGPFTLKGDEQWCELTRRMFFQVHVLQEGA